MVSIFFYLNVIVSRDDGVGLVIQRRKKFCFITKDSGEGKPTPGRMK